LFASTDYRLLDRERARHVQASGWHDRRAAARQEKAYSVILEAMRRGEPRIDLRVAVDAIHATGLGNPSILEVGCGNGYYSEVFAHMLTVPYSYVGVDYAAAMVDSARQRCPNTRFEVADACELPFADAEFEVVFNGVSLMHILDFEKAIEESRRVASRYCVYHSVPLFRDRQTTFLSKYAYGAPVVEVIFNRADLLALFSKFGFALVKSWPSIEYDIHPVTPEHSFCETFLLRVQ